MKKQLGNTAHPVNIRMPLELYNRVTDSADQNRRTVSAEIVFLLEAIFRPPTLSDKQKTGALRKA